MSRVIGVEIVGDSSSVERAFKRSSGAAQTFDRSLGRSVRGAAAGTGVFRGLGRSLAFASGTFLGFAGVTAAIRGAIEGADNLKKAQEGLSVAIEHTGGNVGKLVPKYTAVAKAAAQYGINEADATAALERATVLTGDAAKAQRAYQEALVISKATGKDFNAVLTATAKGQEGITTSLQRYGIKLAKGTSGTEQFATVMGRFSGQAKANTSVIDRLNATWQNTEEIIGLALLPTLDKYLGEFSDWLTKMQQSGRLQRDVNSVVHVGADAFHAIGDVIKGVDRVTGSFLHTLELLAAFKFAKMIFGWGAALDGLIAKWIAVRAAATAAEGAETGAGAAGGVGPIGSRLIRGAGLAGLGETTAAVGLGAIAAGTAYATFSSPNNYVTNQKTGKIYRVELAGRFAKLVATDLVPGVRGEPVVTQGLRNLGRGGSLAPSFFPNFAGAGTAGSDSRSAGPFGTARPIPVYKSFGLTIPEQLAQARASLTKSMADDAAAAKAVIARIKRLIDEGRLKGASLIQALQAEASAISTVQSAEAAAAQARAKALQNLIDPLRLEVQLSKEQALGTSTLGTLRALKASAERALATRKLSLEQQKQAWDQIAQVNQEIAQAAKNAGKDFIEPAKLQLELAREQALSISDRRTLEAMKKAALKAIRSGRLSIQGQIDAWNEIASINQQLASSATEGLGKFKQANTAKLTAGLGLTAEQRKKLRERLSQLGPGGTVPGDGTGAYGVEIDPKTGRARRHHAAPRPANATGGTSGATSRTQPIIVRNEIDLYIDGKKVTSVVTRNQQRHNRRNPSQRRGANAGTRG